MGVPFWDPNSGSGGPSAIRPFGSPSGRFQYAVSVPGASDEAAPGEDAAAAPEHRQWSPLARALVATGDQWTLLILLALAEEPLRLTELRDHLPGISTGVLSRHLQQMVDLDLLARQRFRELPPRVEYRLTERGRALLPIIGSLTRWGLRYMWSDPEARERVDISAIMRLLPILLDDERLPHGVVEMIVELPDGPLRHVFDIDDGHLTLLESETPMPWSSIAGQPDAWVDAFGPKRKIRMLQISGDRQLARQILHALPGSPQRQRSGPDLSDKLF
jgi:DNA-binding HxlR family transcriptional regulator